ncbi:MAG: hypothetical protein SFV54_21745 [Bryobacteraceae bacterium]|nr:hypothetical protein [Bryobacteraceae bacterium]
MAHNAPLYGIDKLYVFPYFNTREDYQSATGKEAPPFKPYKPRKHWFDPKASESARRYVTYERSLVPGPDGKPLAAPDQTPVVDELVLAKEDAAEVNLPPTGDQAALALPEIAAPLRALDPVERLEFAFGGAIVVKNTALFEQTQPGFNQTDRALLRAIAAKLGVAA